VSEYVPLALCPVTIGDAKVFVGRHHRHHDAPQGGLFAAAVESAGVIVGVAVIGRPVAPSPSWSAANTQCGCCCESPPVHWAAIKQGPVSLSVQPRTRRTYEFGCA
jgi:hypothetical protein